MEALQPDDPTLSDFSPGRGLSPLYLNPIETGDTGSIPKPGDCNAQNENGPCQARRNGREYAKLMTNSSTINRIISKSEGSMILPANHRTIADYQATTFGCLTSCRVVTDLCDIVATLGPSAIVNTSYRCTVDRAGLNLSGDFIQTTVGEDFDSNNPGFSLRYYTDSSMSALIHTEGGIFSSLSDGPTIWFAVGMQLEVGLLPIDESIKMITSLEEYPGEEESAKLNSTFGFVPLLNPMHVGGILSCTTSLSDVVG